MDIIILIISIVAIILAVATIATIITGIIAEMRANAKTITIELTAINVTPKAMMAAVCTAMTIAVIARKVR